MTAEAIFDRTLEFVRRCLPGYDDEFVELVARKVIKALPKSVRSAPTERGERE